MTDRDFIWRFSPSRTEPQMLEDIFVQRHGLLADITDRIRESATTGNKHHVLLIGPRGIGKTHLIALLHRRITQDAKLAKKVRIAWLLEDETVTSFVQLLKRIFQLLSEEYPEEFSADRLNELLDQPPDRVEKALEADLVERFSNRTLVLFVENLDYLFDGFGGTGQKQLRSFLQEHPFACIVATSQKLFQGIQDRDEPFFGFFAPIHLKPLDVPDAIELLGRIAAQQQKTELAGFLATPEGRSRVRAIHHLAGGNHRIYIVLSGFITRESLDELTQPFEKMADELTPYYQERLRWLSPQQRQIVEFLCSRDVPVTPKGIARNLLAAENTISSQMKKLLEFGYVTKSPRGRESLYELSEPLMRLATEVKEKRRKPLRLLVDFLRVWYQPDHLARLLATAGTDSLRMHLAAAIEQSRRSSDPRLKAIQDDIERAKREGRMQEMIEALEERAHADCTALNWFELAYYLVQEKRHADAIKVYDKALELDPKFASAWYNKAVSLDNLRQYQAAIQCYDRALEIDSEFARAWYNRGHSLMMLGRYEAAIQCYDKVTEIEPDNAPAWNNKGLSLNDVGRFQAAIECYDRAIEIDPKSAYVWTNKGNSLEDLGQYEAANECYDKAIEIDPKFTYAWTNKGNSLENLSQYEAAIQCYDKAIEIDPKSAYPWTNKGSVLDNLGQYEAAIQCYDKAMDLDPKFALPVFNRCEPLFALQRWELGFAALRNAFTLHPEHTSHGVPAIIHLIHTRSSGAEQLRRHVATLIAVYAAAGRLTPLGDGLVRSLKKIDAEMLSEKALHAWRDLWLELGANRPELEIPLRLFRVGIDYLASRDERVLLDLLAPERRILRQALGLEPAEE